MKNNNNIDMKNNNIDIKMVINFKIFIFLNLVNQ